MEIIIFQCGLHLMLSIIITPTNQRYQLDSDRSIEVFSFWRHYQITSHDHLALKAMPEFSF